MMELALSEEEQIQALSNGDMAVFEVVYKAYFNPLLRYAMTMLKDEVESEEVVQTIFLKIWDRREKINIQSSIKAYLYRSVYNESLNIIKHQKVRAAFQTHKTHAMKQTISESPAQQVAFKNLEDKLRNAMNELPQQCRTIFQLSRYEDLKYREIAHQLNLSEKTVENQMGKALKLLRLKLIDFLTLAFPIIFTLQQNIS